MQGNDGGVGRGINIVPDRKYDEVSVVNPDDVAPLVGGEILLDVGGGQEIIHGDQVPQSLDTTDESVNARPVAGVFGSLTAKKTQRRKTGRTP